jgi:dissimilatory sulfite reductase (desulfoviridin) alpha/beta subunit
MIKCWNLGYEKAKKKAQNIYKNIGSISCPALNDEKVYFNSLGFHHLLRKGRIPRTRKDQKKRFVLLEKVESIMKNPKAFIEYWEEEIKEKINRHGEKILVTFNARFWTFVEYINESKIKIVVRQNDGSHKHFFSIFGDNIQITKGKKITKKSLKK